MTIAIRNKNGETQYIRNVSTFAVEGQEICVNHFDDQANHMYPFTELLGAIDAKQIDKDRVIK